MLRKCLVNNFGFFTYLKDRYKKEKVFHLLDKLDVQELDYTQRLEFQKKLILLRDEIDGKDRLGIQTIKSYLDYLCIQEKQLLFDRTIQSNNHVFYKNISDKCADVDIIHYATILSKVFYYLNGGDYKLLSLQLEIDLLLRKTENQDNQFEKFFLKERLKDVLDKLVSYTNKHYSNQDLVLIQTLQRKYQYHLNNSRDYLNQTKYQEALDELVVSQTQLNEIWQKNQNKDDFRIPFQRLIIEKLVITAMAKYCLKHQDGFQLFQDAINNYVDNIGINEEYIPFYTDIVKFLYNFDQKGCMQVLERLPQILEKLPQFELSLQRLKLEKLKILTLIKLDQLKQSDLDKMIDLYMKVENQNDTTEYEYNLFFYNMIKYLQQYETAYKYLEVALKKLQTLSQKQQSDDMIKIFTQIQFEYLYQSSHAQQIFELLMQISEKSCYRLKDNFNQLPLEDQTKTINTERIIIALQAGMDNLPLIKNKQQEVSFIETFNRLQYLDDQFQANQQLRLPILEILRQIFVEEKVIAQKMESLRQKILDTEILK